MCVVVKVRIGKTAGKTGVFLTAFGQRPSFELLPVDRGKIQNDNFVRLAFRDVANFMIYDSDIGESPKIKNGIIAPFFF